LVWFVWWLKKRVDGEVEDSPLGETVDEEVREEELG
jgi:hypothetical protein